MEWVCENCGTVAVQPENDLPYGWEFAGDDGVLCIVCAGDADEDEDDED